MLTSVSTNYMQIIKASTQRLRVTSVYHSEDVAQYSSHLQLTFTTTYRLHLALMQVHMLQPDMYDTGVMRFQPNLDVAGSLLLF